MSKKFFTSRRPSSNRSASHTSWEKSSKWYNETVGEKGHYYHEKIVLPGVMRLLKLSANSSVLDIGCGQGILAKRLEREEYYGVDASGSLIKFAKQADKKSNHQYIVADATKPLSIPKKDFTHATAIFSLQNMEYPFGAIQNVAKHMKADGRFVLVINHPCFRIPRQSGWGVNEGNNQQYRWVTKYMSEMKIPIQMHPGQKQSGELSWSFHWPLAKLSEYLFQAGFMIEKIEEWSSDKKSQSREAKREDMAREEIPLFMVIVAVKLN
jgi:ubiquinone/menaquinone biosynthesis C-methylase UbiE